MSGVNGLTAADLADLVTACNDNFPAEGSFEYLYDSTIPRNFEMLGRLAKDKLVLRGGEYISDYVVYRENGTAQFVLPGQVTQPSITNVMKKVTIPWCHVNAHYSMVNEELRANVKPEAMVNIIKPRRASTQVDMATMIEKQWIGAYDSTDSKKPLTLSYWGVPITAAQVTTGTTLNGAFQGQLGVTGATDIGGINPVTAAYARWRNWNAESSNSDGEFTLDDAERLGRMFDNLNFDTVPQVDDLKKPVYDNRRVYINYTTKLSMERRAAAQNDNLGADLAKYQNSTMFRGYPLVWLNQLDTYSAMWGYFPIIVTNWAYGQMVVREGVYFREETFAGDRFQHDMTTVHMDLDYQLRCTNRQQFVGVLSYVAAG